MLIPDAFAHPGIALHPEAGNNPWTYYPLCHSVIRSEQQLKIQHVSKMLWPDDFSKRRANLN
jgi:hypothetical protein